MFSVFFSFADNDVESMLAESKAIVMTSQNSTATATAASAATQQAHYRQLSTQSSSGSTGATATSVNAINQQMLESQCSINSTTSIQTVLHQSQFVLQQQQQQQQTANNICSNYNNNINNHHQQHTSISATTSATTTPKHLVNNHINGSISMLQQSIISNNSNNSNNSAYSIPYGTEALAGLRHVSGSVNSLLEHIAPATMSSEGVLNIGDVADLLHPQHAIITGGRSQEGCPLIIFPDNNNFNLLEEVDYQKLILYLTSVPS